jgi:hypothetical protein
MIYQFTTVEDNQIIVEQNRLHMNEHEALGSRTSIQGISYPPSNLIIYLFSYTTSKTSTSSAIEDPRHATFSTPFLKHLNEML